MSIVEKAKRLDAEIAAGGGLGPYWITRQKAARARGEAYYTRLVDPATDEVVAEWDDRDQA